MFCQQTEAIAHVVYGESHPNGRKDGTSFAVKEVDRRRAVKVEAGIVHGEGVMVSVGQKYFHGNGIVHLFEFGQQCFQPFDDLLATKALYDAHAFALKDMPWP